MVDARTFTSWRGRVSAASKETRMRGCMQGIRTPAMEQTPMTLTEYSRLRRGTRAPDSRASSPECLSALGQRISPVRAVVGAGGMDAADRSRAPVRRPGGANCPSAGLWFQQHKQSVTRDRHSRMRQPTARAQQAGPPAYGITTPQPDIGGPGYPSAAPLGHPPPHGFRR